MKTWNKKVPAKFKEEAKKDYEAYLAMIKHVESLKLLEQIDREIAEYNGLKYV